MNTFTSLADLLLAKWLWSMTFDWYHLFINLFLMAFLVRNMHESTYWRAFLFSLGLQAFAFAVFTGLVVGILYYALGWEYVLPEVPQLPVNNYVMRSCLALGIIYSMAQTIFIFGWHFFARFRATPYLIIIWGGNFIAAVLSYCLVLLANSLSL